MNIQNHLTIKNSVSFIIISAIFFGASCLKKQNLEEDNLGAVIPPEQIAAAISNGLGLANNARMSTGFGLMNYDEIKANETTSITLSQTIQDGVTQNIEQQNVTILEVHNTDSQLEIQALAKIFTPPDTTNTAASVFPIFFTKYQGYAFRNTSSSDGPIFLFQVIQSLALNSCYDEGDYPETCHNLTVVDYDHKVPFSLASQHPSCDTNPTNCYIKAKRIEFDLIRKYEIESDGKPKRIHYTLELSQEVPFTAKVLRYCTRTLYDITGVPQKILADLCYSVNNYTFAP